MVKYNTNQKDAEDKVSQLGFELLEYKSLTNTKNKLRCHCGNIFYSSIRDITRKDKKRKTGCGCTGSSSGNFFIKNLLDSKNIKYEQEKSFDSLIGIMGGLLSFDFYISDLNTCREHEKLLNF